MRQGEKFVANASATSLFFLGRNSRGQWVAQDQSGRRGGLFASQSAALKYALFENGRRPELVVNIPGVFELGLSGAVFA
ncbi:MAG: hypothetical protein AB7S93_15905 [Xanthobacteraceae bacterium]